MQTPVQANLLSQDLCGLFVVHECPSWGPWGSPTCAPQRHLGMAWRNMLPRPGPGQATYFWKIGCLEENNKLVVFELIRLWNCWFIDGLLRDARRNNGKP